MIKKLLIIFVLIGIVGYIAWIVIFDQTAITKARELLIGTNDINVSTGEERAFSISPDGKWLMYISNKGTPFAPVYVLYDVAKRERQEIALSESVRELVQQGRGPLMRVGCWEDSGSKVFLPGDSLFVVDLNTENFVMESVENVDSAELRFYYECPELAREVNLIVSIIQESPERVLIVDVQNSKRLLAEHKKGVTMTRIAIDYMGASPDGKYLTYNVTEYRGSFIGEDKGYILNVISEDASPHAFVRPVFRRIQWSPDGRYVYAVAGDREETRGIYRWLVENL